LTNSKPGDRTGPKAKSIKSLMTTMMMTISVCTTKKKQHLTITKYNTLMLFTEIIAVYTENHTKHKKVQIHRLASRRTDIYHQALEG
jgi:hypothetical protein